jgi:hypothetical protein
LCFVQFGCLAVAYRDGIVRVFVPFFVHPTSTCSNTDLLKFCEVPSRTESDDVHLSGVKCRVFAERQFFHQFIASQAEVVSSSQDGQIAPFVSNEAQGHPFRAPSANFKVTRFLAEACLAFRILPGSLFDQSSCDSRNWN